MTLQRQDDVGFAFPPAVEKFADLRKLRLQLPGLCRRQFNLPACVFDLHEVSRDASFQYRYNSLSARWGGCLGCLQASAAQFFLSCVLVAAVSCAVFFRKGFTLVNA